MKIDKVIIKNFKSIADEEIDFSHNCKILVGLSESGKTNLLLALNTLNPSFKVDKSFLKEGTKLTDKAFVRFYLSLDKQEMKELTDKITNNILSSTTTQLFLDGTSLDSFINYQIYYEVNLRSNERSYKYFSYEANLNLKLNSNYAFIKSSSWPVKIIKKENQESISIANKVLINKAEYDIPEKNIENIEVAENIYDFFEEQVLEYFQTLALPQTLFWKYDEKTILPSEVLINSFSSNPQYNLPLYYIFKLSNIDNIYTQYKESIEISETAFQNLLDEVSNNLNKYLKKIWKSMSDVTIQLEEYVDKIRIRIVDSKNKYVLKDRSDGFKRLITFMIMLSLKNKNGLLNNNLILIDEPNSQIDIPGQQYLMTELINIGKNNYVFYSTHSDSMIDTTNIERHYIVTKENENTKIEIANEENYNNAAALYQALGMNIYKVINENNLVFEGWTDTHLLSIVVNSNPNYKKAFKSIGITHVGGAKNFKSFARYWGLLSRNYLIIADNDEPANREKKIFEEDQYIGNWLSYNDLVSSKQIFTAEDFLKSEYILKQATTFANENNFINHISLEKLNADSKMDVITQWIASNVPKNTIKETEREFKKILFTSLQKNDIEITLYNEFINNLLKYLSNNT